MKLGAKVSVSDSTSTEFGTAWKYLQITGTPRAVDSDCGGGGDDDDEVVVLIIVGGLK